jgi:sec-independent protein translocase protein TatA
MLGQILFIGGIGMGELLIVLAIVVIIFGASRLPQLGRGLGEGISNFRDGLSKGNRTDKPVDEKKPQSLDA